MEKFNESLWFDKRMWAQDIRGSVAYAKAIGKVGIITDEEVELLIKGLGEVHKEWEEGKFEIKPKCHLHHQPYSRNIVSTLQISLLINTLQL